MPSVLEVDRSVPVKIRCPRKRNAMHGNVARIFRRVERKVHPFIVYTINSGEGVANRVGMCRYRWFARYLRVVTLEDKVTVHNAFPDRRFRP